jgi:hypothetical protein
MLRECRHIKDDGLRCHAAAMNGKPYCFFHMKIDRLYKRQAPEIPPLEDSTSVLLAIGQVVRGLNNETIDCRRAGLMLYGLQIAATVTARRKEVNPADSVRSIHNLDGESVEFSEAFFTGAPMLAPENSVCEPPHDCESCPQNASCEKRKTALRSTPDKPENEPANGSEEAARQVRDELYSYMLQQSRLHPESSDYKLPSREEFHHFALEATGAPPVVEDMGCEDPGCPISPAVGDMRCEEAGCPMSPAVGDVGCEDPGCPISPAVGDVGCENPGCPMSPVIGEVGCKSNKPNHPNREHSNIDLAQSPQSPLTRGAEPLVLGFGPLPEARHECAVDLARGGGIPHRNRKVAFHSDEAGAAHG